MFAGRGRIMANSDKWRPSVRRHRGQLLLNDAGSGDRARRDRISQRDEVVEPVSVWGGAVVWLVCRVDEDPDRIIAERPGVDYFRARIVIWNGAEVVEHVEEGDVATTRRA